MKKDYSNILLGYRGYNDDKMYGKDFVTLDPVVAWISQALLRDAETTKEFCDFAEQEYGIEAIIQRMKELPDLGWNHKDMDENIKEVKNMFDNRNLDMKVSDFNDTNTSRNTHPL